MCSHSGMESLPDDPFVSCVFDEPGVAVWLHEGEPGGPLYVLTIPEGRWPAERLQRALALVPESAQAEVLSC